MIINAKILKHRDSSFGGVDYHDRKMPNPENYLPRDLSAVDYNEGKRSNSQGKVNVLSYSNFDPYVEKSAKGIRDFLRMHGANNTRTKQQQFHAVISCRGREVSFETLEQAAHLWVKEMGYGQNPYVLYSHEDTDNNHVHVVTSRIGPDGKKIPDSYEKLRSTQAIKRIGERLTGQINIEFSKAKDIAFSYQFTTAAQFNMLMENFGFKPVKSGEVYHYVRFGEKQGSIPQEVIKNALTEPKAFRAAHETRISQLTAIIHKYADIYNPNPYLRSQALPGERSRQTNEYTSELAEFLKRSFGLQVIFHAAGGKPPYGYTAIDNSGKSVYKGTELVGLKQLLEPGVAIISEKLPEIEKPIIVQESAEPMLPIKELPSSKEGFESEIVGATDPLPGNTELNPQNIESAQPDPLLPSRDIFTELIESMRYNHGQNGEQDRINNRRKKKKR